jgi:dextranase
LHLLLALLLAPAAFAQTINEVNTDKGRYNPGQAVSFTTSINSWTSGLSLVVQYYQANTVVSQQTITPGSGSVTWTWTPPNTDYRGYLVGLTLKRGSATLSTASIGVDVSSDWARFPRYGFLSKFGPMTDGEMDNVIGKLNRYHLNGIQFYDWMDKHHRPLAGTPQSPSATWNDLANRPISFATVKGLIDRGHNKNMTAMFYELIYGAYPDAANDGVATDAWGLYFNSNRTNRWYNGGFPSNWEAQGLNVLNPANPGWRSYFLNEVGKVYDAANLNFDGWHVDQLGDNGTVYNYDGQTVQLGPAFGSFLSAAKQARSTKRLVMNAVNQFGQSDIAAAPVDMTYTEMWTGNEDYVNLGSVIQNNESLAPGKRTVLAAYVNKGRSENPGQFNPASVLMADAVIFAFGGAHIELGEHMLGNEYFPNSNLQMSAQLEKDVTSYYDFAVAYENLLRDGRTFNNVTLSGGSNVQAWPPALGKIATVGSAVTGKQIFQVLNFTQARTLNWRDNAQEQPVPTTIQNVSLNFPSTATISSVWTASPDFNNGLPQTLAFTQSGNVVNVTLPNLKYWSLLVAEAGTPPPATNALKVYFKKPTAWASAKIHFWNTAPTGSSTNWPGVDMTAAPEVGENWFSYTFASGISSANLVFNNNGDNATKTADQYRSANGYYDYASNSWSTTAPFNVYFKKPTAWGSANIHYWNTSPTGTSTNWPGIAMTAAPGVGAGWFGYTFPSNISSASLVFNNNGDNATKTADLSRNRTGYYNYATGTWTDTPPASREALASATSAPVAGLELAQNVPNPFDQATTIRFAQPSSGPVKLELYNLQGQHCRTLLDAAALPSGAREVVLPGATLAPGVYFYRLTTAAGTITRRLVKLN